MNQLPKLRKNQFITIYMLILFVPLIASTIVEESRYSKIPPANKFIQPWHAAIISLVITVVAGVVLSTFIAVGDRNKDPWWIFIGFAIPAVLIGSLHMVTIFS